MHILLFFTCFLLSETIFHKYLVTVCLCYWCFSCIYNHLQRKKYNILLKMHDLTTLDLK